METNMTIDDANKIIQLRDDFLSLQNDPRYINVITNAYFVEEAKRLPHALVNDNMLNDIDQEQIINKIKAIGHLELFFIELIRRGNTVEAELKREEEEQNASDIPMEIDDVTGDLVPVIEG